MNIFYITRMKIKNQGGLFNATYERIIRHSFNNNCYVVNNNYYDSKIISSIKKNMHNVDIMEPIIEKNRIKNLEVNNLNFKNSFKQYFKRKINMEKSYLKDVSDYYIKKYGKILSRSDAIHAHWGYPNSYIAYKLSLKYNLPYFITFHGNDINNIKDIELNPLLEAMENADKCFFVSEKLLKNAIDIGYSGNNSEITYNGVDTKKFQLRNKENKRNKTVGYIGALLEVKGADLLPEIFTHISKSYVGNIEYIIVGDGNLKERIQSESEKNKLPVNFTGHVDFFEVPDILCEIDVLIVPSRNEGLGMVILEANAMGIPAVGSNIGGIPEAIGFKENLIDIDSNMIENMADRVVEILTNEVNQSEKYRNRMVEEFDWEEVIRIENLEYIEAIKD